MAKSSGVRAIAVVCFGLGVSAGWIAAKGPALTDALFSGKTPEQAGASLLAAAEDLAGSGSWERIAVARVYYLSGDTERGRAILDGVTSRKPEASDWFRIGQLYAEAAKWDEAFAAFDRALAMAPKDDSGMALVGAWRNLHGDREAAETLFRKAFGRGGNDVWHAVRAAGSYLGVPPQP